MIMATSLPVQPALRDGGMMWAAAACGVGGVGEDRQIALVFAQGWLAPVQDMDCCAAHVTVMHLSCIGASTDDRALGRTRIDGDCLRHSGVWREAQVVVERSE